MNDNDGVGTVGSNVAYEIVAELVCQAGSVEGLRCVCVNEHETSIAVHVCGGGIL